MLSKSSLLLVSLAVIALAVMTLASAAGYSMNSKTGRANLTTAQDSAESLLQNSLQLGWSDWGAKVKRDYKGGGLTNSGLTYSCNQRNIQFSSSLEPGKPVTLPGSCSEDLQKTRDNWQKLLEEARNQGRSWSEQVWQWLAATQ